jgi:hypothetical protein
LKKERENHFHLGLELSLGDDRQIWDASFFVDTRGWPWADLKSCSMIGPRLEGLNRPSEKLRYYNIFFANKKSIYIFKNSVNGFWAHIVDACKSRCSGQKMLDFGVVGPFSPTTKGIVHSFIESTISWCYQHYTVDLVWNIQPFPCMSYDYSATLDARNFFNIIRCLYAHA